MDILDDMGASKLSAKVFFKKVNYSFNDRKWHEQHLGNKMISFSIYLFF